MAEFVEKAFDIVVFVAIVVFCIGVSDSLRTIAMGVKELGAWGKAKRAPADDS